jgi:zinc/manganese transport system substrate-binding protein
VRKPLGRSAALIAAVLVTTQVTGCDDGGAHASGSRVEVVASTNVYADIASTVGGDRVHTTSFVSSPDQDPHSYEASGRNILAVSKADLVIENGGGYDDFMDQLLASAGGDPIVVNVVDISGLDQNPASGAFNEHVWYSLPVAQKAADAIASALSRADPDHQSEYRDNANAFDASVQKLIDREASAKQDLAGMSVAITEPVPGYMLDALSLVNATPPEFSEAIEEGNDVAVSVLKQTLDLFADHKVVALVYNEQTTGPVTEQALKAARDAGVPVVPVTETLPAGESYVSWMTSNLDRIAAAVQG